MPACSSTPWRWCAQGQQRRLGQPPPAPGARLRLLLGAQHSWACPALAHHELPCPRAAPAAPRAL
eukprot:1618858-Pyramimonas_sp.AAC.1